MIYVHEGSIKSLVNFASKNKKKADFSVYEFEASGFSEWKFSSFSYIHLKSKPAVYWMSTCT